MSFELPSPNRFSDDPLDEPELLETREVIGEDGLTKTFYTWSFGPRTPPYTFEHDTQKGLFQLTWPDGQTERFRERPVRYLQVEPDPDTGAMRPVTRHGHPVFIYLSREEREM
jgi:hypothetical protein